MIPASFEGENCVLSAPDGMEGAVEPLCVLKGQQPDGLRVVISCWKATREELDEINRTGRVWLLIVGCTMQPAMVCGLQPFELDSVPSA